MVRTLCMAVVCAVTLGQVGLGSGQEKRDADFLRRYAATYRFSLGRPTAISLTPAGDKVLFLRSGPRDFVRNLYEVDAASGAERLLLSAEKLLQGKAEQLTAEELARRERMRLAARGIAGYELSRNGRWVLVPLSGKLFVVERETGTVQELATGSVTPLDARFSPDATSVAYVADGDLHVIDVASNQSTRLTSGASETLTRGLAEFVAQEEMDRMHGYWWSPDSDQLVYQETDTSPVEQLEIADPAHPERPPQSWRYPRAGTANAVVRLAIVSKRDGESTWIEWDSKKFPYLTGVSWEKGSPLVILVQNRAQTIVDLLEVDPTSGKTRQLLRETDDAWVNLDSSVPRWTPDAKHFLWRTERNGAAQLELRNRDGSLNRPLHDTSLVYRELLEIDDEGEFAYVIASAEPIESHVYRLPLGTREKPQKMTAAPGIHSATFSRLGTAWVDTLAGPDGKISQTIRKADSSAQSELKSVAESPGVNLKLEWTQVTDDAIRALIVRPNGFRAGKKYPVVVHVYGGPHSQMVTAAGSRYALAQWIADQGYIVVSLDGRGTPGRTRDWERAIRGNLIEIPLEDQVRGLKALAEKYPELDLQRVGIFGWSFGGYFSALATSRRPEVFQVGVAGAPVTDWRDYDTHYTERYLGLPETEGANYDASSALKAAEDLRRPLLLIHGTADDNVYFMHSLKLSDALFRAGRPYEFLPLVGMTHMVTEPTANEMLYGRIMGQFDRVLRP